MIAGYARRGVSRTVNSSRHAAARRDRTSVRACRARLYRYGGAVRPVKAIECSHSKITAWKGYRLTSNVGSRGDTRPGCSSSRPGRVGRINRKVGCRTQRVTGRKYDLNIGFGCSSRRFGTNRSGSGRAGLHTIKAHNGLPEISRSVRWYDKRHYERKN